MDQDKPLRIRAVVADLSGTLVDFGSRAAATAFVELFRMYEVPVTLEEARTSKGMDNYAWMETLLFNPAIAGQWELAHGRHPDRKDVDRLYQKFAPLQLQAIRDHCDLIPGVIEAAEALRKDGVSLGVTTDYDRAMLEIILRTMTAKGLGVDSAVCVEDVPEGRPHPWMVFRSMERLGAYPPACVVKIGDTASDIEAGCNAGVWSVGVTDTGSLMGITESKLNHMRDIVREERREDVEDVLLEAGAHALLHSFAELPGAVREINQRLARGERPSRGAP